MDLFCHFFHLQWTEVMGTHLARARGEWGVCMVGAIMYRAYFRLLAPCLSHIHSWKYNVCNLSNIATLEGYLCTSCSDRSHEGALLRLRPVLSNQNRSSSSRPNETCLLRQIRQFWIFEKDDRFALGEEIWSRSGEFEFPNVRLLSLFISTRQKFIPINLPNQTFQ